MYQIEPDSGLHGACEWLLRKWDIALPELPQGEPNLTLTSTQRVERRWYTNTQGQTMVVVPAGTRCQMGSPRTEKGRAPQERETTIVTIPRTFAISTKLVTVADFKKYKPNHKPVYNYSPEESCPRGGVTWFDCAGYCNWLSKKEGIPEDECCYEQVTGISAILKASHLKLKGYRLATAIEFEAIVRAGTSTSYSFGENDRLLTEYGWYINNGRDRSWQPGQKKPNEWGGVDAHGNLDCWCDALLDQNAIAGKRQIKINSTVSVGGGSFSGQTGHLRSANHRASTPTPSQYSTIGFRLARTLPAAPTPSLP